MAFKEIPKPAEAVEDVTTLRIRIEGTVQGVGFRAFVLKEASARRLTGCDGRSAAVALLWALHPLRVEPVSWVTARKDMLSGLFFFLSLGAYARYAVAGSRPWFWLTSGRPSGRLSATASRSKSGVARVKSKSRPLPNQAPSQPLFQPSISTPPSGS